MNDEEQWQLKRRCIFAAVALLRTGQLVLSPAAARPVEAVWLGSLDGKEFYRICSPKDLQVCCTSHLCDFAKQRSKPWPFMVARSGGIRGRQYDR